MNLNVSIGALDLTNPVMTASGTFGYGPEYESLVDVNQLGAIIVKGTTLEPRQGNPYPRMAETPSGMINAVGLHNPGVNAFMDNIYPRIYHYKCRKVVNVSGSCIEDYVEVCRRLEPLDKVDAVEINISCPNVKKGGMGFGTDPAMAAEVTRAVRQATSKTMIVKLSPNVTDIVSIAKAVEAEGADGVSLINTIMAMAVDVERRRPVLSTITGGLSGPAVRPVAVRMVWQVANAVKIPVIGLGGIMTARDALEFIMAGATAVQVGTANFVHPAVTLDIIRGIEEYGQRNGIADISELIGCINRQSVVYAID